MDALGEKLAGRGFQGVVREDRPGEDHGVIGAVHLASLVEHVRQHKPGVGRYGAAIQAIAGHNLRKRIVKFSEEPLSFLLILCDTVQEWNRPHLLYSTAALAMMARAFSEGDPHDVPGPVESASVMFPAGADTTDPIQFELVYDETIGANAGVFQLWIDTSSNLQRLDMDGFFFEVELRFVTPDFRRGAQRESQMHRLRQAADETHMNFLADWFPSASNAAVRHKHDEEGGTDTLELNLHQLMLRGPVTAQMKTFFKLLSRWSRFNEDRGFAGDYAPEPPG